MERLRTFGIILVTAIITCVLTSAFWFMAYSGVSVSGTVTSAGPPPKIAPTKPGGVTPTIVTGFRFNKTLFPIMSGLPAKRLSQ